MNDYPQNRKIIKGDKNKLENHLTTDKGDINAD